jgi:hypothetical protein
VYDHFTSNFELCFSFDAPQLDFQGYFLLSGSSGQHNPDHVYVEGVKLYDPKTSSNNEHFREARRQKQEHDLQQRLS